MGDNERRAASLAAQSVGAYQPDMMKARGALEAGSTRFTDADIQSYMNPYIKGALDPVAREARLEGARRRNEIAGQASSMDAWSGSRSALMLAEQDRNTQQQVSDIYGKGYASAFESGAQRWADDMNRQVQIGGEYMKLAGLGSDLATADFSRLMESGEVQRYVDQLKKDFDYQQFVEKRDWSGKNAAYLTDVLRGLKGSYSEKTKTSSSGGSPLGQVLGAAATIAGAYFTGGATLAWGAAAQQGGSALSGG